MRRLRSCPNRSDAVQSLELERSLRKSHVNVLLGLRSLDVTEHAAVFLRSFPVCFFCGFPYLPDSCKILENVLEKGRTETFFPASDDYAATTRPS
jgi:hypothetical protein